MHETTTLHFDLSHLACNQEFTLHTGSNRYTLTTHTQQTLAQARRKNKALALLPDEKITHFAESVQTPGNSLIMLRVTAPKLRSDDLLDRLVLTSFHLPRQCRQGGLAWHKHLFPDRPLPAKLSTYGVTDTSLADDEDIIIDVQDYNTAFDAAVSLVFHHPELLTVHLDSINLPPLPPIVTSLMILGIIGEATGIAFLAQSIEREAKNHERFPSQPNWVNSQLSIDWKTGQPSSSQPIYVWSDNTVNYLAQPLQSALQQTKNVLALENQCWTVQPGVVQVPMTSTPQRKTAVRQGLQDAEANYTVTAVTPESGVENQFSYDPSTATATISLKNYYLRWLQISVDQYGPNNEVIGSTQSLSYLSPPDTVMAVPIPPDWSDFSFVFDEKASSAIFSIGGLGQAPFDKTYDGAGIIWTALFNLGVPTFFIALGVAVDQLGEAWTDATKAFVSKESTVIESYVEGPAGEWVTMSGSLEDLLLMIANIAVSMVLDAITSSPQFAAFITSATGQSSVEDAAPFIGWVARAIGSAADVASIVETSVEVARSPAIMQLQIVRTMDLQVTVSGDPKHQYLWPSTATHYRITVTYDDGPTYTYDGQIDPTNQGTNPVVHTFSDLPAGGSLTILASFYSDTDWLAGQGKTNPMDAQPSQGSTLVVPEFAIKENLVPLTTTTTYSLKEKLGWDNQSDRIWITAQNTSPPTATVSDLNLSNVGNNLGALGGFGINESQSTLAYLWEASGQNVPIAGTGNTPTNVQLWTFQTISYATQEPESGLKFSDSGYTVKPCLALPPSTLANPIAAGFLLEPSSTNSNMYLRALSLESGQPLITSPGNSFGCFTGAQDNLAIHPAGYAVALCNATCKLQIVKLAPAVPDAQTPVATILSGQGTRDGLLYDPVALTCSLDRILVLQAPSATYPGGCIVAFDYQGNPVYGFAANQWSASLRPEGTATVVLVDVSVESKGYIYVLKYLAPASGSPVLDSDYRLDIYNPDGSFLTQISGIAAARLQVDFWRNLFTLNYEILQGSGRTEPTVAEWIPSTPSGSTSALS
jgi:hypothetical protein